MICCRVVFVLVVVFVLDLLLIRLVSDCFSFCSCWFSLLS